MRLIILQSHFFFTLLHNIPAHSCKLPAIVVGIIKLILLAKEASMCKDINKMRPCRLIVSTLTKIAAKSLPRNGKLELSGVIGFTDRVRRDGSLKSKVIKY